MGWPAESIFLARGIIMRKYLFTSILILGCLICTAARPEHAAAEENETLPSPVHVSVHDPSIMEDKDGTFYIVGSHTASASSEDLIAWEQLNFDYGNGKNLAFYGNLQETLEKPFRWAGFDDGDCSGNGYAVWAPDLIWNPYYKWEDGEEGAYMLYVCTSSTWRRSCISFLVSKDVKGPYTFGDTIVYSGFTKNGEYDGKSTRDTTWDNEYLNLKELVDLGAATYHLPHPHAHRHRMFCAQGRR